MGGWALGWGRAGGRSCSGKGKQCGSRVLAMRRVSMCVPGEMVRSGRTSMHSIE